MRVYRSLLLLFPASFRSEYAHEMCGIFARRRRETRGLDRSDASAFLVVLPVMGGAALLASYLPARRSARVDPTIALRD